jgi:hypothetical protein
MLEDVNRAKIVITNYHAFKLRERIDLSKGGRSLLQGRGEELNTLETEGQMLQRVMPDLMGMKNILALNDEAHHCYREKPGARMRRSSKGDDKKEAEKNNEAARLWISGLEAVNRKLGLSPRHRSVGHTVLPERLRLCRGHAVPVDDERLSRSWMPSSAASSNCRASPSPTTFPATKCRCSAISGRTSAKTCPRRGAAKAGARPPQTSARLQTRFEGALRPLREDFQALGGKRHQGAAVLHRRLQ